MARLNIDIGTAGNPATGDSLRGAFTKVNTNFSEIYSLIGDGSTGLITTSVTNGDLKIQPNGTGIVEIDRLKITDDDITSLVTNGNIAITGNGTGGVTIEGVTFNGTSLSSADSTQIQINEQVDLGGNKIVNLADPTADQHAATKAYVDTQLSSSSHSFTFVGDDSTGTSVTQGETFKFAGTQNISTAVSGDTLTITGPDLSSYATTAYVDAQNTAQALTFVGDDSTGTAVNSGETFKIAGTQNITTAVSGDTLTITGPDLSSYLTSETSHADVLVDGDFASAGFMKTNGSGTYSIDANTYLTSVAFGDLTSTPTTLSGYGITDAVATGSTAITVVGDDSTGTAITLGETFKIAGGTNITTAVSGDTLTITGPDLTSYLTAISVTTDSANLDEPIVFVPSSGNKSSVRIDSDNKLTYNPSTNTITLNSETITSTKIGQWNTAYGWGDHASAGYLTGIGTQTIDNLTFNDNIIGTSSNADLILQPGGTGQVVLNSIKSNDSSIINVEDGLTVKGTLQAYQLFSKYDPKAGSPNILEHTDNGILMYNEFNTGDKPTGSTGIVVDHYNAGYTVKTISGTVGSSHLTNFTMNFSEMANGTEAERVGTLRFNSGIDNGPSLSTSVKMQYIPTLSGESSNKYFSFEEDGLYMGNTLANIYAFGGQSYVGFDYIRVDGVDIKDNTITTNASNADLELSANGTGQVVANSALKINKGYIEAINALTSSSTITVDFSTASVHTVTLAENTQFVVTNLPTGGTGTIIITQDGGGTNTATFGTDGSTAVKFAGGTPTLSTAGGAIDVVTVFNDGVNYLGNIAKAYA